MMDWNKLNTILLIILCLLTLTIVLFDISVNVSWSASITDWLSVTIYFCTLVAASGAVLIAQKALNENRSIANDTKRMVDDNSRLIRVQTEPFIDIKLEIMPQSINWIRLKVTNIGLSSAFNISFKFKILEINNQQVIDKVIREFSKIGFMTKGLSYLSKEDVRYTTFINLYESNEESGFSSEDFFNTSFVVEIEFSDISGKKYKNNFQLIMNELEGEYSIGETGSEKIIEQLKSISKSITAFKVKHEQFKDEYEKSHRNWTEEELRIKVRGIDLKRAHYKFLGKEYPEAIPIPPKKISIQQLRKQNK